MSNTTYDKETDRQIHLLLQKGTEDRPITSYEIESHLGLLRNSGTVRDVVRQCRLEGEGIASSGNGYWYTTNAESLRRTAESIRGRTTSMLEVAEALEKTASKLDGNEREPIMLADTKKAVDRIRDPEDARALNLLFKEFTRARDKLNDQAAKIRELEEEKRLPEKLSISFVEHDGNIYDLMLAEENGDDIPDIEVDATSLLAAVRRNITERMEIAFDSIFGDRKSI